MACGSCGARKAGAPTEYEITYKDGSPREVVKTIGEVRVKLAMSSKGGTYRMVPKTTP
jgi:hypothetical protein